MALMRTHACPGMPAPAWAVAGASPAAGAAVFLDKDGTVLRDVPYNVAPRRMAYAAGARDGLARLARLGLPLIVVSNQPGVALGRFAPEALAPVRRRLARLFAAAGASMADFLYCPHHPAGALPAYAAACGCRKPMPGLLREAARRHGLDLDACWMIGDILDDVEAGRRAGCRTVLLDVGSETEWRAGPLRAPHYVARDLDDAARLLEGEA